MISLIGAVTGRVLLALLFIVSGFNKLFAIGATNAAMVAVGLPDGLGLVVALVEIILGFCIALGIMLRFSSLILAAFTFLTILFFHREFSDPLQATQALKNLAIIGGLLCLFAYGHLSWSYDAMRLKRRAESAEARERVALHEAELRAAQSNATVDPVRPSRGI